MLAVEADTSINYHAAATEELKLSCPLWKFMIKAAASQKMEKNKIWQS